MVANSDLKTVDLNDDEEAALEEAEYQDFLKHHKLTPRYYDDYDENWRQLRQERGDVSSAAHNELIDYLIQVIRWLFRAENYTIHREVNFYETYEYKEKPLYPDIFILKSQQKLMPVSYHLEVDGPPPDVNIEIISPDNTKNDTVVKVERYAAWGVKEYFAYDPRIRKYKLKSPRLLGWRLIPDTNTFAPIIPTSNGRMWSEELGCWLVPDNSYLRLYDDDNNMLLTGFEAKDQSEQEAIEQRDAALELQQQALEREQAVLEREKQAQQERDVALELQQQAQQERDAAVEREQKMLGELEQLRERLRQLEEGK